MIENKLTVIIPCYNRYEDLVITLNSCQQVLESIHEVVVIDDGSTLTGIKELCDEYKVRYVRTSNMGLPSARNNGVRNSTGDNLLFLDAGDRLPSNVQAFVDYFIRQSVDIAYCSWSYGFAGQLNDLKVMVPDIRTDAILQFNVAPIHAHIVSRDCFIKVGGFSPSMKWVEDWEFWLRCYEHGMSRAFCETPLAEYLQTSDSMSRNKLAMAMYGLVAVSRARSNNPLLKVTRLSMSAHLIDEIKQSIRLSRIDTMKRLIFLGYGLELRDIVAVFYNLLVAKLRAFGRRNMCFD